MSTIFKFEKSELFEQLISDGKLFTFEKFIPGIDEITVGSKATVAFSDKKIDVKVVRIMTVHPSFKDFGHRVELVVC